MVAKVEDCSPSQVKTARGVDRVFEAARELFYRNGVRATGVDQIVAEAGVTKPTLYRAFESKDELLAACLRDYAAQKWAWWDEVTAPHAGDPRGALLALLRGCVDKSNADHERGCALTNIAIEMPGTVGHAAIMDFKLEARRRLLDHTLPLAGDRADALTDALILVIEGAMASRQIFGPDGPNRAVVDAGAALIDAYAA